MAKTGTLSDVKALSGEQPGSDGRPVEFSLVLNALDADEPDVYLPVWDALVELIDTYPVEVEPDASLFEPRSSASGRRAVGSTAVGVMPMFPLGAALLPGAVLPLVVFEPRYRQMVMDLLADDVNDPEFGVVMIERGLEVGGGDARTMVGTVARVIDMSALPDGRYALVAVGVERLRVSAWLPDDPYPLADVDVLARRRSRRDRSRRGRRSGRRAARAGAAAERRGASAG